MLHAGDSDEDEIQGDEIIHDNEMIHEDENSDIYDTDSSADDEIELAQFLNEE